MSTDPATLQTQFPSSRAVTQVEAYYQKGEGAYVCGAIGAVTVDMLHDIEVDFADNPEESFPKGDGRYLFDVRYQRPQFGDDGRMELAPYWELTPVAFQQDEGGGK